MVLEAQHKALRLQELDVPQPASNQLLIRVSACGVCRTDLHVVDGELADPKLPLILGHEIVGRIEDLGAEARALGFRAGQRVGVPWLGSTCGTCSYCSSARENLCDAARFTGYQLDGGYAEYSLADHRYCFPLAEQYSDAEAAPLLCAGLIGYRALRMAGAAERLGIYGFGAAAHIVAQLAHYQGRRIYAFTRPGDSSAKQFALSLGACWAGDSGQQPPEALEAAILFAPVGALIPMALRAVEKGGCVVCAGIHMSEIPAFPYEILWGERSVCSVANLTRRDGLEFLELAPKVPISTDIEEFDLVQANAALDRLRGGRIRGAAVLTMR